MSRLLHSQVHSSPTLNHRSPCVLPVRAASDRAGVSYRTAQWHLPHAAALSPWLYSVDVIISKYRSMWFKMGVLSQRAVVGWLLE